MENKTPRHFVRSYLPWLVAAAMLVLYVVTLNKHVSASSIPSIMRWGGIDWRPAYAAPFTWLVTLPVRWLPLSTQLVALNLIGAVCAALTLALLARSVALLPHDRTHDQRLREKSEGGLFNGPTAWIPPVFALLMLGLQRTFWENAIVCTGESIDALLIAYVVRCLLEFRVDRRDSWLYKLSFVYGVGIANSYAFIAYAPAMLVALVWVKALRFFQLPFLLRLGGFGVAGLCFYLLLPTVQSFNEVSTSSFIGSLRVNLGFQKSILLNYHRALALWLGGFPLVLLLVGSIKWSSGFGDTSRIGSIVGTIIAHVMHAALLVFAGWMLFDLAASPRQLAKGLPFLNSYYLTALAAGYFIGYLLLVFSDFSARSRRSGGGIMVPLSYLVTALVAIGAIAAPVKLGLDNYRNVSVLNRSEFQDFARQQLESLPKQPAVVLSDDFARLYAVALLGGNEAGHVMLEGSALATPAYVKFIQKKYAGLIPTLPTAATTNLAVSGSAVVDMLAALKQKRELYYLNPSFGLFFETYYLSPQQLVYRLENYPTNAVEAPVPSNTTIAQQAEYWNRLATSTLRPLAKARTDAAAKKIASFDLDLASRYYSQALNVWGVELQRAGRFDEAANFFDLALTTNPDNPSAFINREANAKWRKDRKPLDRISDEAYAKLQGETGGINGLLTNHGAVDEPSFRNELAQFLLQLGLGRQAAQHELRAIALAPQEVGYQNALANIYLRAGQVDRALAVIKQIRDSYGRTMPASAAVEVIRTEAAAYFGRNDLATTEKILKEAVSHYPDQDGSYEGLMAYHATRARQFSMQGKKAEADAAMTNALRIAEQQVQQQPNNPSAHFNLCNALIQLGDFENAIKASTRVIDLNPKNAAAYLNRAIAELQANKLDDARRDYEKVLTLPVPSYDFHYRVQYGLAEIAVRKKDWKAARQHFEQYLKYAPEGSDEAKAVRTRLAEVKKKD